MRAAISRLADIANSKNPANLCFFSLSQALVDYVVIKLIQPKVESAADNRLRFLVEIIWSAALMAENEIFSHHGGLLSTDPAPLGGP